MGHSARPHVQITPSIRTCQGGIDGIFSGRYSGIDAAGPGLWYAVQVAPRGRKCYRRAMIAHPCGNCGAIGDCEHITNLDSYDIAPLPDEQIRAALEAMVDKSVGPITIHGKFDGQEARAPMIAQVKLRCYACRAIFILRAEMNDPPEVVCPGCRISQPNYVVLDFQEIEVKRA